MDHWPFLEALQDFNDFLRAQKGAYGDACAGYRRNEVTMKRQVARVMRQAGTRIEGGRSVAILTAVEDPSSPDAILHTIRLSHEYLDANRRGGANEQQMARAIIVFIFTYWEAVTRHRCAAALGIEHGDLKLPIVGDLRLLRISILHHSGLLRAETHRKLEVLGHLFQPDDQLSLPHATMQQIFKRLDRDLAQFSLDIIGAPSTSSEEHIVSKRVK